VVKRMLKQLSDSADFVNMFLDEARIAARLVHHNIVQITDLGQSRASRVSTSGRSGSSAKATDTPRSASSGSQIFAASGASAARLVREGFPAGPGASCRTRRVASSIDSGEVDGERTGLQQWESFPGAARGPLGCYRRREPESTVLHRLVSEHLESFLRELAMEDR
jgi:hypothetical protein